MIANSGLFAWETCSVPLAGALWLSLATAIGAPVSTTHSIIAAVVWLLVRKSVARLAPKQDNSERGDNRLFT